MLIIPQISNLQNKDVFSYAGVLVGVLDINHFFDDERYNPSERALSEAKANVSIDYLMDVSCVCRTITRRQNTFPMV